MKWSALILKHFKIDVVKENTSEEDFYRLAEWLKYCLDLQSKNTLY